MVSLRGIPKRGQSEVRKLNKELSKQALNRALFTRIRNGDSISSIKKFLNESGVNTSAKTLERSLYDRYTLNTLSRYYTRTRVRFGARSGFSLGRMRALGADDTLKVRVSATTKDGETRIFDTFVRIGQATTLEEIVQQLIELYEENNNDNKSPLENIKIL